AGYSNIGRLVVSNYDEDHLSDLPNLCRRLAIRTIHRNDSVGVEQLRKIKTQNNPVLGAGMSTLLRVLAARQAPTLLARSRTNLNINTLPTRGAGIPPMLARPLVTRRPLLRPRKEFSPIDLPGVKLAFFSNPYPLFQDTNNLSQVTFLHYGDIHLVFPGDLEKSGWQSLLQLEEFREQLAQVNVFVASHQGRLSGYCPGVFNYCQPEIIIISDKAIQYETQKNMYRNHTRGVYMKDRFRYVLTTRCDGMISIWQRSGEPAYIATA